MSSDQTNLSEQCKSIIGVHGEETVVLSLNGCAIVSTVGQAVAIFKRILGQANPVIVDLTTIAEVDVSFIQLLLALGKSCKAKHFDLSLSRLDAGHVLYKAAKISGILPSVDGSWFNIRYPYPGGPQHD